ncbi:probable long-chain-alcohol O-fatty-acyltransferase 5 [Punica granatum]|uniref:Wax synthase domain-containing protein n=2 Tax=Punica granatum TaxID=22663 RepID=A0A218XLS3_PUNGR|nr:probable long-chain-alcohol O-fatty-acyltransferase 5 [Punica granatum]OWM85844.1 hypothetical protein CDL15_Pgr012094 [Punica granatum]PKI77461.1 hypothetical protein CRG98_002067 [Punica granatum]
MDSEIRNFIHVWLTAIASLCYCYYIPAKLPKGMPRLLSLVPVFGLFALLPLRLSTVIPTGFTSFCLTWLANSRLLLLAFDSGPLFPKKPLPIFVILACLSTMVTPHDKPNAAAAARGNTKLRLNYATKTLLYSVLVAVHGYKDLMSPKLLMALYSCMFYLFNEIALGFFVNGVRILIGVELEPPSDEPYLSTSLQDFWGRRWNLVVTDSLRQTVYKPIRRAVQPILGVQWAPLPAVLASFLVSGIMHELLFYYITRAVPTWEVTWFFVFHGMCVILEVGIKVAVKGRWQLHPALSGPMVVVFVVVTATWWFYPPLVRNGAVDRSVDECKALVQLLPPKPNGK